MARRLETIEEHGRLAEVSARLALAIERANAFEASVDPRVLMELREAIDQVLELAGVRPGCRHGCEQHGFQCPISDPLEKRVAKLQASGWVASWDAVEARVAHDKVCLCGCRMSYLAYCPGDGELATAWAVCGLCRHWTAL